MKGSVKKILIRVFILRVILLTISTATFLLFLYSMQKNIPYKGFCMQNSQCRKNMMCSFLRCLHINSSITSEEQYVTNSRATTESLNSNSSNSMNSSTTSKELYVTNSTVTNKCVNSNSSDSRNVNFSDNVFKSERLGGLSWGCEVEYSVNFVSDSTKLKQIRVYHDPYVYGMDFIYSDNTIKSIGYKVGKNSVVDLTTKEIRIVRVKSGAWMDFIEFCFSQQQDDCLRFGGNGGIRLNEYYSFNTLDGANLYRITGLGIVTLPDYSRISAVTVIYENI